MVAVTGLTGTLCLYPVFPSETAEVTVCFCFGVPFYFLFVSNREDVCWNLGKSLFFHSPYCFHLSLCICLILRFTEKSQFKPENRKYLNEGVPILWHVKGQWLLYTSPCLSFVHFGFYPQNVFILCLSKKKRWLFPYHTALDDWFLYSGCFVLTTR